MGNKSTKERSRKVTKLSATSTKGGTPLVQQASSPAILPTNKEESKPQTISKPVVSTPNANNNVTNQNNNHNINTTTADANKLRNKSLTVGQIPANKKTENDSFSIKRLESLFAKYMDSDDQEQIGPENMAKFCTALEVDPEDVVTLVLAWHLNAKDMGYFKKSEFIFGLQQLGCDTIPKIKAQLELFKKELDDPSKFKEIYKYAFTFAKEKDQKILDLSTAKAMLNLVMGDRFIHTKLFLQFLTEQTSYKAINLDQWMSFLEFSKTINADFSNYDENGAWPVLLDEYVEWKQQKDREATFE